MPPEPVTVPVASGVTDAAGILVVEDDPEIRDMLAAILTRAGYTVRTAANGLEALDALAEFHPALILLDIHMPMMDGTEFRRVQRQLPELRGIPTVVMTAANIQPLFDLSADVVLQKPVHLREILQTARRYCVAAQN